MGGVVTRFRIVRGEHREYARPTICYSALGFIASYSIDVIDLDVYFHCEHNERIAIKIGYQKRKHVHAIKLTYSDN